MCWTETPMACSSDHWQWDWAQSCLEFWAFFWDKTELSPLPLSIAHQLLLEDPPRHEEQLCPKSRQGRLSISLMGWKWFPPAGKKKHPTGKPKMQNPPDPQTRLFCWVLSSTFERKYSKLPSTNPFCKETFWAYISTDIHIKKWSLELCSWRKENKN